MKVLFAYNGRVEVDAEWRFYGNELNDTLVNRYLYFGNVVSFLVRSRPIQNKEIASLQEFKSSDLIMLPVPEMNSPIRFLKNRRRIHHLVKEAVHSHDIIISRQPGYVGRLAARYARETNKPYLVEVVGCPFDTLRYHSLLGKILAPYARNMLRESVARAPFVLYVTRNYLQIKYPTSGVQTGISDVILEPYNPLLLAQRLKHIDNEQNDKTLRLGTAAGLDVPYKGHAFVLKAMALLKKMGITVQYEVVGKGSGSLLQKLADDLEVSDQFIIKGQLPHTDIFIWMDSVDIYIQPSLTEGLPRALVEAMSRGCYCLGSKVGGIPELLDSSCLFEPGNAPQLAEKLMAITKADRRQMAELNIQSARSFERDKADAQRTEFYDQFLQTVSSNYEE